MGRNTSIAPGDHFEHFVDSKISDGRFKNASEVIRAGLRLLEEEESRILTLKNALQEGLDSGIAKNFDRQIKICKNEEWLTIHFPKKLLMISQISGSICPSKAKVQTP